LSRWGSGLSTLSKGLLLHGNIRVLAFTSMLTGLYVSMLNTVLQPFVVTGFGLSMLGILQSVGSRPSGLASSIVQPFAGLFADLVGRKQLIVIGSAVAICSMVSFFTVTITHSLPVLALAYILFGLSLMSSPASQAMVAESVSMDPAKLDVAFSVIFFFTQVPGALAAFAGGFIADAFGYYVIFGAAAVLESANLVCLISLLKETGEDHRHGEGSGGRSSFSIRQVVRLPPRFLRFFTPFAMDAFSYGIAGSIIYGMWVRQFGYSSGDIGVIVGTLSVSTVVCQYPATKFLRMVGTRRCLAFSEFLTVVVMIGWATTGSLLVFILLSLVFGVSIATWVPALQSFLMTNAPPEERGSVGGKLAAVRGLIASPAPIIGSLLFNSYGYYLPVTLGLIGEAFTTLAILRLLPKTNGQ
jgi:DHA1 family multidrug resistance protein-like MFS transporter